MYYVRQRYYDAKSAQFISVDPITHWIQLPYTYANDSPLNYTYANDSPLNYADPSGLESWSTAKRKYSKKHGCDGKVPIHPEYKVPKELHHKKPRRDGGSNCEANLEEVWPWEHDQCDPYRHYRGPVPADWQPDSPSDHSGKDGDGAPESGESTEPRQEGAVAKCEHPTKSRQL